MLRCRSGWTPIDFLGWCIVLLMVLCSLWPVLPARDLADATDFINDSELIFVGTLVGRATIPDFENGLIRTRYEFRVDRFLKGSGPRHLSITELGGVQGGLKLIVSHGVSYRRGGRYLVFAAGRNGGLRTLGGTLGRLPLIPNGDSGEMTRIASAHPLRGASQSLFLSIEEIELQIRRAVRGDSGR